MDAVWIDAIDARVSEPALHPRPCAARPEALRPMIVPSACPTSAKQSPPIPVMCGSVMHKTADAVTAASTALPPARNTSIAASVASGEDVAAMPFSDMDGRSAGQLEISHCFVLCCAANCETVKSRSVRSRVPKLADCASWSRLPEKRRKAKKWRGPTVAISHLTISKELLHTWPPSRAISRLPAKPR